MDDWNYTTSKQIMDENIKAILNVKDLSTKNCG